MAAKKKINSQPGIPGKLIAKNKRAFRNFELLDRLEAGLVLMGTEVKSLRGGRLSFKDTYARFMSNELFLLNFHISQYENRGYAVHDPERPKKLLLNKKELKKLRAGIMEKGLTIVPTCIYFKGQRAKVEIALARGKKNYDKRHDIAKKDEQRRLERQYKGLRL